MPITHRQFRILKLHLPDRFSDMGIFQGGPQEFGMLLVVKVGAEEVDEAFFEQVEAVLLHGLAVVAGEREDIELKLTAAFL